MGKKLEIVAFPADVMEKAKIIGNVFEQLKSYRKMLEAIDEIVNNDWAFDVVDCKHDLTAKGGYLPFTQEESIEMSEALGNIYSISHAIHCGCGRKWGLKND